MKGLNFVEPKILVLEGLWGDTGDIINAAGGMADEVTPWEIDEIELLLSSGQYHGLILTGGSDIDPRLYNEKPHKEVYGVDLVRDTGELVALMYAEQLGIPVLGICRGSQMMCAFKNGSLTQHIEGHRGGEHMVTATPEAKTFTRAINSRDMNVISLHHQCVKDPGEGMIIAARAFDNTPEAIESEDGLWLGCQYHPEMNAFQNGNSFAIFQWLVSKAAEHMGGRPMPTKFREVKRAAQTWRRVASTAVAAVTSSPKAAPKNRPAGTRSYKHVEGTINGESAILHICDECGMLFDEKMDRDDHLKYIHEGEPFPEGVTRLQLEGEVYPARDIESNERRYSSGEGWTIDDDVNYDNDVESVLKDFDERYPELVDARTGHPEYYRWNDEQDTYVMVDDPDEWD